ncbi:MAG: DNA repair exonuclease, partial [Gemmatimonadales bacterium]
PPPLPLPRSRWPAPMRFLHLADLHLDTLFAGRSREVRDRLRAASRDALSRGVDTALREEVDAVLLAGDVFDGERLSFVTERFLVEQLQRLGEASIPVVMVTGNHDPGSGLAGSRRIPWPPGVTVIAGPEPRTVSIHRPDGSLAGTVTGAGHPDARTGEDLSRRLAPPESRSTPAIALLHTHVTGAGGAADHDRYAPSELPFLRSAGFDYWALGHIHARQELERMPAIWYAGNPQGRNPGEAGARGGLLVEVPARGATARVRFVELGSVRWELLVLDGGLEDVTTLDELVARVGQRWQEARKADPGLPDGEWIVRVRLSGPCPLARELRSGENREALADELARALGALEVEVRTGRIRTVLDPAPWLQRQDAAGAALRLVDELARGDGPVLARLGLTPGDLAGGEGEDDPDRGDERARALLRDHDGLRMLLEAFARQGGKT